MTRPITFEELIARQKGFNRRVSFPSRGRHVVTSDEIEAQTRKYLLAGGQVTKVEGFKRSMPGATAADGRDY